MRSELISLPRLQSSDELTDATIDLPGPSTYFANLALQAARQWKFAHGRDAASDWILRFDFSSDGTEVSAKSSAP
jgi:hypothetical protein